MSIALEAAVFAQTTEIAATKPSNQPQGAVLRQGGIGERFGISDADSISRDFETFVADAISHRSTVPAPVALPAPAVATAAWWAGDVVAGGRPLGLNELIDRATRSSFQIGVFGALPAIRDTGVDEARGRFTPRSLCRSPSQRPR